MSDAEAELALRRWDAERDGPPTEAKLRALLEARGYTVTRYAYSPGTRFPPHAHGVAKIDAVLEGVFRMGMNGQFVDLGPGDWLEVPAGAEHSAEVVGDATVVSLDAVRR
jgi:quercetin dioxygenase-like cupin family protein